MAEAEGRFLLGWRTWTLWFIPVLATLYFVWILLIALNTVKTPTVTTRSWVIGGMVVFAILLVFEVLLLLPKRGTKAAAKADEDEPDGETVLPYAPPDRTTGSKIDAEYAATTEQYKGMRVLELSIPAKSRNRGGVYAKSYVQVAADMVLRIEDLVADKADIPPMRA